MGRPDDDGVAVDGDRSPELLEVLTAGAGQLGLQGPLVSGADEDQHRALVTSQRAFFGCTDHGRIAGYCDRAPELVAGAALTVARIIQRAGDLQLIAQRSELAGSISDWARALVFCADRSDAGVAERANQDEFRQLAESRKERRVIHSAVSECGTARWTGRLQSLAGGRGIAAKREFTAMQCSLTVAAWRSWPIMESWMKPMLMVTLLASCSTLWTAVVAADNALPAKPIISADALAEHLRDAKTSGSPLDAMPVGARRRFLASLRFGSTSLGGFELADLEESLTRAQIADVLAIFGAQKHLGMFAGLDAPRAPRQYESAFELRFNRFDATDAGLDTTQGLAAFRTLLDGHDVIALARTLDRYEQALLYRALLRVLALNVIAEAPEQAAQVLTMLHDAGDASKHRVTRLFDALVVIRRFDLAGQVATAYPGRDLPSLPKHDFDAGIESTSNAMLLISADGRAMSRSVLDLAHGVHIVVVAGCHFAREAAVAISADPALDQLFRKHATWLGDESESIDAVAEWNREFPHQPIQIAWRNRDWPQIRSWAMPTFHVFKDGKLLSHWDGWSADSGRAILVAELKKSGLIE